MQVQCCRCKQRLQLQAEHTLHVISYRDAVLMNTRGCLRQQRCESGKPTIEETPKTMTKPMRGGHCMWKGTPAQAAEMGTWAQATANEAKRNKMESKKSEASKVLEEVVAEQDKKVGNVKGFVGGLMPLMTIEPEAPGASKDESGWTRIDFAVDSGASETVLPAHLLTDIATTEGEASRRGVLYEVANGERIPNLGEKRFLGETHHEGIARQIRAQVCEVSKPLMSVAKLVKAGNTVVFSPDGSYIWDQATGEYMALEERSGMYTLGLWTHTSPSAKAGF